VLQQHWLQMPLHGGDLAGTSALVDMVLAFWSCDWYLGCHSPYEILVESVCHCACGKHLRTPSLSPRFNLCSEDSRSFRIFLCSSPRSPQVTWLCVLRWLSCRRVCVVALLGAICVATFSVYYPACWCSQFCERLQYGAFCHFGAYIVLFEDNDVMPPLHAVFGLAHFAGL